VSQVKLLAHALPQNVPKVDRSRVDPQLVKAAEGMEAMFIGEMMKAMRKTVPEGEHSLNNAGTRLYQSLLDAEHSKTAARAGNYGLADLIIANMMRDRYTSQGSTSAPAQPVSAHTPTHQPEDVAPKEVVPKRTGGTHEG